MAALLPLWLLGHSDIAISTRDRLRAARRPPAGARARHRTGDAGRRDAGGLWARHAAGRNPVQLPRAAGAGGRPGHRGAFVPDGLLVRAPGRRCGPGGLVRPDGCADARRRGAS
ncbi:hypothetical protein G6F59_018488 [Rhizopus arrhizus]|nr:hypothetical protein G6F59_018488 [Rhizopus arrhizus]